MWSKVYGLGLFISLLGLGYLGIEGGAHLTLKGAHFLKPMVQKFPQQRQNLRKRWMGVFKALDKSKPRKTSKNASLIEPSQLVKPSSLLKATFMGLSTLRDGIDVPTLHRELSPQILSLSGSGGTLKGLEYLVDPILKDSHFSSDLGIIVLHPMWFAGWDPNPPSGSFPTTGSTLNQLKFKIKSSLKSLLWLISHRTLLSQSLNVVIADLRQFYLSDLLTLSPFLQAPPHKHPWYKKPAIRSTSRLKQGRLNLQWKAWMNMGKGELKNYHLHQETQFKALKHMIESAGTRVKKWVVIRMSEHSRLRSLTPSYLDQDLSSSTLSTRLGTPIEVWNASTLLNDDSFFDYAHLNQQGRRRFTEELIRYLKEYYADLF